jgi:hypothetical protein
MIETRRMKDLILEDELVNDFEFAERLYQNGLSEDMADYYASENLIWADML